MDFKRVVKWYNEMSNQTKGTVLCVVGILIMSPDALLVRKVSHLPDWTVQFYRYMFFSATLAIFFFGQEGAKTFEKTLEIGYFGLLSGLIWGTSMLSVSIAFQLTAAANVLVILASNPIFAAFFSFIILGEKVPLRTAIAGIFCFLAIVLIFASELGGDSSVDGVLYSLAGSIGQGLYFTLLRLCSIESGKEPDMMPCLVIAGLLATIASAAKAPTFALTYEIDWLWFVLMSVFVMPIGCALLTIGPSLISAPEVSLFCLIETVLGPVWVYLGGYEAPPISSIYGGLMLVIALSAHSFVAMREESKKQKEQKEQGLPTHSSDGNNNSGNNDDGGGSGSVVNTKYTNSLKDSVKGVFSIKARELKKASKYVEMMDDDEEDHVREDILNKF